MAADTPALAPARHRPRFATVFVAAFVAGAAAAVGVNRALDLHLAQAKPQVECEPIFVALRSLPQGTPVTVWDVALRDWPKAMLPAAALRVNDSFEGCLLKHPLREGQPLLTVQLIKADAAQPAATNRQPTDAGEDLVEEAFVPPPPAEQPAASPTTAVTGDRISEQTSTGPVEVVPDVTPAATNPVEERATAASEPQPVAADEAAVVDTAPTEAVATTVAEEQPAEPTVAVADTTSPEPRSDEPAAATVAGQPTLAASLDGEPAPSPEETPAATVTAAAPTPSNDSWSASDIDSSFDVPSRPPVDLSSMPSVMSQAADAAAPIEDEPDAGSNVRYLVVPERIARQADTSFTTPTAPEGGPIAEQTQASDPSQATGQPPANTQPPSRSQAGAQPSQRQPATAAQRPAARPQARQAEVKPLPQSQQSAGQPRQQRGQTQPKVAAQESQQTSPRAWGGMFPNVSAGLDAIGAWRGRTREAAVPERPAGDKAPQRR
jgi:hypothetical protein